MWDTSHIKAHPITSDSLYNGESWTRELARRGGTLVYVAIGFGMSCSPRATSWQRNSRATNWSAAGNSQIIIHKVSSELERWKFAKLYLIVIQFGIVVKIQMGYICEGSWMYRVKQKGVRSFIKLNNYNFETDWIRVTLFSTSQY